MKKIILFIWLSFVPFLIDAQQSVMTMIKKHEQTFGTKQITLSGNFIQFETTDEQSANIDNILIDIAETANIPIAQQKEIIKQARSEGFEEYIQIREGNTKINVFLKENAESIQALLLQINGEDKFLHLYIEGSFRLSDLEKLDLNFEGMDEVKKIVSKA